VFQRDNPINEEGENSTLAAVRQKAIKLIDDSTDGRAGDVEVSVEQVVGGVSDDCIPSASLGIPHCEIKSACQPWITATFKELWALAW
jgi:hypothetical protein